MTPRSEYLVPPCPWCDGDGGVRIAHSFAWTIHERCADELEDWLRTLPLGKAQAFKNRFIAIANNAQRRGPDVPRLPVPD